MNFASMKITNGLVNGKVEFVPQSKWTPSQPMSSSSIASANKEVQDVLDRGDDCYRKRGQYSKYTGEEKAQVAK